MLGKKKILAIVAIAVIIISVCAVGVWYSMPSKSVELEYVTVHSIEKKTDSIEVKVMAIPKEFSGQADLKIEYSDSITYSGNIMIKDGIGVANIPYNQFIMGNGEYSIKILFKNKTGIGTTEIYGVVESINVFVTNVYYDEEEMKPKIEVEVWPNKEPLSADVKVTITRLETNEVIVDKHELTTFTSSGIWIGDFNYTWSGNYTVYAHLTNNNIKETSTYLDIYGFVKNGTGVNITFINLKPVAVAMPETQSVSVSGNDEGWTHFCGGNSTDYDDDDATLDYLWYFDTDNDDDDKNDTRTGKTVSYQYEEDNMDTGPGGLVHIATEHTVTLGVIDRWGEGSSDTCIVTVNP